jgi:hypothetical protein
MTAEQFADAIGSLTGEWCAYQPSGRRSGPGNSDPLTAGVYGREWRAASNNLTRALGRPIRDQVISVRGSQATTPQALELVNGEILTRRLEMGARRLTGELKPPALSMFNKAVAGRNASSSAFDIDVSNVSKLWLIVEDTGSNAPERVRPAWVGAELVGSAGPVPLGSLPTVSASGIAGKATPIAVPVRAPSRLEYDLSGRRFTRFRGNVGLLNSRDEIGSTLNPSIRFFVFDTQPDMERLLPPAPELPFPAPPIAKTTYEVVDRVFWYALGRAPSDVERRVSEEAVRGGGDSTRMSAPALADLLWALMMKPEFQLIY